MPGPGGGSLAGLTSQGTVYAILSYRIRGKYALPNKA
jgi:hypothetical protein